MFEFRVNRPINRRFLCTCSYGKRPFIGWFTLYGYIFVTNKMRRPHLVATYR